MAVLAADPGVRAVLEPEVARRLESELGPGMVRVVGGVALEKTEKKRWERRRGDDE